MGKELLTDLENAIFKNWLRTRPKMETNEPNVYPTILGGVSRGFWGPFEALGARSAIFWHLKTGTFGKGLSGALFPLPRTPNFKWSVQWHLWVYKFETCFWGSPHLPETALQTAKDENQSYFFLWSSLMVIIS